VKDASIVKEWATLQDNVLKTEIVVDLVVMKEEVDKDMTEEEMNVMGDMTDMKGNIWLI
jgi:hypothetical protein